MRKIAFWQMFDFYPTCWEKTKHVGIFTPGCFFPHMFGFWHIGMGKGTHVWKKPHNYMFANVCHFPHMCGKSHWHAYIRLSYRWEITKLSSLITQTSNALPFETLRNFRWYLFHTYWDLVAESGCCRGHWKGDSH